jgi:hypothetical protein
MLIDSQRHFNFDGAVSGPSFSQDADLMAFV